MLMFSRMRRQLRVMALPSSPPHNFAYWQLQEMKTIAADKDPKGQYAYKMSQKSVLQFVSYDPKVTDR